MGLSKEERQSIANAEITSGKIKEILGNIEESDTKINLENITTELTKRRAKKIKK